MNLVEAIRAQLDADAVETLSAKIGAAPTQTETAIEGAVPALLAALNQVSQRPGGAQMLSGVLESVDEGVADNLSGTLKSNLGGVVQQGSGLLAQVLGGGGLMSGVSRAVSSYSGLSQGSTSSLLGLLGPLIMSSLKRNTESLSPESVSRLLSEQQPHISAALPQPLAEKLSDVSSLKLSGLGATSVPDIGAISLDNGSLDDRRDEPLPGPGFNVHAPATGAAEPSAVGGLADQAQGVAETLQDTGTDTLQDATRAEANAGTWRIVLYAVIAILAIWLVINIVRIFD